MGAGGMTTVRRPRVRIEVRDVVVEVESKAEVPEEELLTVKGTKRKRAPPTKGPCEHGVKQRSNCKVCSACPHGRKRSRCKECGGSHICEHGRERSKCKECGGASVCEHGRERYRCKECESSKRIINQTITYGVVCSSLTMTAFLSSSPVGLARHDRATSLS